MDTAPDFVVIDGDPGTQWSSNGDGNDAWIEIDLATETRVTGVGF